jgi:hypothetical protein
VGREVAHGGGEDVDEEAGALEIHAVAGELAGDLSEGALDVVAGVEGFEQEGLVFDDGEDGVGAVVVAHVLAVHGDGAATSAVLVGVVHALVGFGGFAAEVGVGVGHGVRAFVYTTVSLMRLGLRVRIYFFRFEVQGSGKGGLNGKARRDSPGLLSVFYLTH